jgi:outer membrane protein OmpA-like peptidoglycan-associated protein
MKSFFIIVLITAVCGAKVFSQSYKAQHAQMLSDKLEYNKALPVWTELSNDFLKKQKGDWDYLRKTAEAAYKTEQYEKSLKWNKILIDSNRANAKDWLLHLDLLCLNKKYDQLPEAAKTATEKFQENTELKNWLNNAEEINRRASNESEYTIKLHRRPKKGEEYGAFPYESGIVYVSCEHSFGLSHRTYGRTGQNFTDICFYDPEEKKENLSIFQKAFWIDLLFKNRWREIKRTQAHDGPIAFNQNYDMAFITVNQAVKDTIQKTKFSRLELRVYELKNKEWVLIDFPFNSNKFSTGHGTMDSEGNLYFASDRPGGFGGVDIYKTKRANGNWQEPENLGPAINTSRDELFPYISSKNILYFSSNGLPGMGGLDIFYSELDGSSPVHLGAPINTNADDFAFHMNEETGKGFLSSNRENMQDLIYEISKPVYKIDLIASLKLCNGEPLGEKEIQLYDLKKNNIVTMLSGKAGKTEAVSLEKGREYKVVFTGNELHSGDSLNFKAPDSGTYEADLNAFFKNYYIKLNAKSENGKAAEAAMMTLYQSDGSIIKHVTDATGSFVFFSGDAIKTDSVWVNFINHEDAGISIPKLCSRDCRDTLTVPIIMTMKKEEEFIRLDMVLYNFDKWFLRPEGKTELDKLVKYMKERPDLRVELSSHTDSRGTFEYNINLSNRRSQSCVEYIISQGIKSDMIIAKGYGETKLVNHCKDGVECSVEDHQANRRTELRLLTIANDVLDNQKLKK